MTYYRQVSIYEKLLIKYDIALIACPYLRIDRDSIGAEDLRLMTALLDIDDAIHELCLGAKWFKGKINAYPFKGRTPKEMVLECEKKGLLEIRIYLTALRQYALETIQGDV